MHILVLSGSTRTQRQTHQVAEEVTRRLKAIDGFDAELLDLQAANLPFLDLTLHADPSPSDELQAIGKKLEEADGFIIVSPEYNAGFPGVLKNFMDYFLPQYKHKPAGIVAVSAGMLGGVNAARTLQGYLLQLKMILLPSFLITPKVQSLFKDGKLTDEGYSKRLDGFLAEYAWLAKKLK